MHRFVGNQIDASKHLDVFTCPQVGLDGVVSNQQRSPLTQNFTGLTDSHHVVNDLAGLIDLAWSQVGGVGDCDTRVQSPL